jgi:dihydroorotase
MTKGEYCQSKGIIVYNRSFDEEDADESFKRLVDNLAEAFYEIYNENEDSEV